MKQKSYLALFVLLILLVVSCAPQAAPLQENPADNGQEDQVAQDQPANPDEMPNLPHNLNQVYLGDLESLAGSPVYTLNISLDQDGDLYRVTGSVQVVYTNQENAPLKEIYFKLIPNMGGDYLGVSNLAVDGTKVEPQIEFGNTVLRVDLPDPLAVGAEVTVSMDLDAVVPSDMGGNYGLYIYQDNIIALDAFFPIIPVYNDEGWNVEAPPENADVIFSDVAFFSVTVNAPEEFVIAAGGQEVDSASKAGRQTVTYHAGPAREFYLAASPDFVMESAWVDGVRITSYFPEVYRETGENVLETARIALESFNDRFGAYPYTELDLVSTPMLAGGMEYSSITALGLALYDPEFVLSSGLPGSVFLEGSTAHEVAHMWFYGQVMNDQIDHPWQDESLVQYATYLYYVDRYGKDNASAYLQSFYDRWDRVARDPIPIGYAAPEYKGSEYSAIIYGRGALMFEAMEEVMGKVAFKQFFKDYVAKYRWQVVEPEDLLDTAQDVCGCDLSAVYEEWGVEG